MSGHEWERTDGPEVRVKMSLFYPNTWRCARCGARSGPLRHLPSEHSRVDRDGYTTGRGQMRCDEYAAFSVLSS